MPPIQPCSLPPEALEERVLAWRTLKDALVGADRTKTGAVLRYRLEPEVADALLELIAAERHCCPSLSFEPTVTVRIEAPETMRQWVASTFVPDAAEPTTPAREELATVHREAVKEAVRAHYAAAAGQASCCHHSGEATGIGAAVYGVEERDALPEQVIASSIGCANPVAMANLAVGETVLDLGSGGGLDVLLSAQRVGPTGKAYGLDMTDEMLHLARQNQADAGIDNAEFLRGSIEAIPLPDDSVDVVLSNCVLGLSPDKEVVFAEAYRVLRPWGRLAVADVVAEVEATPDQQADVESWVSCLGGALTRSQYQSALQAAGFAGVSIEESHPITEGFASVVVRAVKRRSGVSEQRERPSPDHRL